MRNSTIRLAQIATALVVFSSGACSSNNSDPTGATASGGASNTATPTGGQVSLGGNVASGGTVASGGVLSSGGTIATGGAPASGGGIGNGGASVTGGVIGAGGASSSGGNVSTGGRAASGGSSPNGGASISGGAPSGGAGGGSATGGRVGTGGLGSTTGGATSVGGSATGGSSVGGGAGAAVSAEVPSSGCGKTSTLTFTTVPGESGTSVGIGQGGYVTIQSGGQSRGFAIRLPDNYDKNKPYWLIFGFHWNGGNSKEVDTGGTNGYNMSHFGLQKLSNNGAIFVAPDGLSAGWANSGGRDLTFVDDMVKLIEDNYCVDTKHLFANGFSYGGGMSYAIACARGKVFRGVAIYDGAQLSGCDGGTEPIAYWQMAGLTDNVCTIGMATPMRDKFAKNNGCIIPTTEPPRPAQPPPYLSTGGHVCTDYLGCSTGHPLRWCVHQSGHGNAIVDGTSDLYNSCATPPKSCSASCPCTWVPADVWSFFTSL